MENNENVKNTDYVEMSVIELDGNQYFLVDTLEDDKNIYYYFSNLKDNKDVKVLKEKKEGDEEFFISLDNDTEVDYAYSLFYEKYKEFDDGSK